MYFGAISTDIKKSSTLWMNFPAWMKDAVKRTNNVTEYVFKMTKTKDIEQKQLPNSPEGDAYTFFYQCEDQDKLIEHVKRVGHILQNVYKTGRDKNILKMENEDEVQKNIADKKNLTFVMSEEFYQAVFVRVGVAFSAIAPIKYDYKLESFNPNDESYENNYTYTSYWESVIAESERAEAKGAPYKDGIGLTQENAKVIIEPTTDENSRFEVDINIQDDPIKVSIERLAYTIPVYDRIRSTEEKVNGYMIFVHYKLHIQWDDVQRDPHLYQPMVNEFKQVHNQTKETMQEDFPNIRLVKVKRSADSMFFMQIETNKVTVGTSSKKTMIKKPKPSDVWTKCLQICSHLPTGSSIGICFTGGTASGKANGKLNKLTDIEPFEKYYRTDFFGDCVNLAARMAGVSWCYQTGIFKSGKNDHHSRVAMCNAEQTDKGWSEWKTKGLPGASGSKFITPLKLEDIPRKTLNAGTGFLRTISAHVFLGQNIQVGDMVTWTEEEKKCTGRVLQINYLFADIEGFKQRKNITYLQKVKTPPLQKIAPALPKKEKQVLKGSLHSLKF